MQQYYTVLYTIIYSIYYSIVLYYIVLCRTILYNTVTVSQL